MNDEPQNPEKVHKKRGRKPKGGKIVKNEVKYVKKSRRGVPWSPAGRTY